MSYTNWDSAMAGTGIFNILNWVEMDVVSALTYEHTLAVTSFIPTSPFAADFTAMGTNHTNPGTWSMWGTVDGDAIAFTLDVDGSDYMMWAQGTIASDGSMSGTATHSVNDSPFTWSAPAGSAFEVRHFDSDVTCAVVDSEAGTASFGWQAGTDGFVVSVVTDGGSPGAGNDTYDHGYGSAATCTGALYGPYPIIGGNLTVH